MTVYKIAGRRREFTMIDNGLVNDPELSAKAKGLMLYLLSKPDHWQVILSDVVKHFKDGEYSIRKGLEELEIAGYIVREQDRREDGKFAGFAYLVYEKPLPNEQRSDPMDRKHTVRRKSQDGSTVSQKPPNGSAVSQFPVNGEPVNGKLRASNIQLSNTDISNILDAGASDESVPSDDAELSEFDTLFPREGDPEEQTPPPFTARDLQTPDGRRRAQEHLIAQRSRSLDSRPWLSLEHKCKTIMDYSPGAGVDRDKVLQVVAAMVEANVPLDYQSASEVRFWLKETESLLRKAEEDPELVIAALEKAQGDGMSIKSPKSLHYSISNIMQERGGNRPRYGQASGGNGSRVTVMKKIRVVAPEGAENVTE